ncbi:MAG: hypothetical protein ACP5N2_01410 [Candidatus Nanoarchaeia archaeon]
MSSEIKVYAHELINWAEDILVWNLNYIVDTSASCGSMSFSFKDPAIRVAEKLYLKAERFEKVAKMYVEAGERAKIAGHPDLEERAIHRSLCLYLTDIKNYLDKSKNDELDISDRDSAKRYAESLEREAVVLLKKHENYKNMVFTLQNDLKKNEPVLDKYYYGGINPETRISREDFPVFYSVLKEMSV